MPLTLTLKDDKQKYPRNPVITTAELAAYMHTLYNYIDNLVESKSPEEMFYAKELFKYQFARLREKMAPKENFAL